MPEIQEFIFKIKKSKDTLKLIDYLKSLDKVKPVKTSNGEKKSLPIRYRDKNKDLRILFGIWKNDKKSLKEIRKNWDRKRRV